MHGAYHWTPKFYTDLYADIGAGDANLTWLALGSVNYSLTGNVAASLGFRWLQFDATNLDIAKFEMLLELAARSGVLTCRESF